MNIFTRVTCLILILGAVTLSVFSQKQETMTVKVYFGDSTNNPYIEDCSKVKAVYRKVPKTKAVARATLKELFKGPTNKERKAGYFSWFTKDSKHILKNITIKDGNAYVNFDKWVLENMGNATTSCGGANFLSEIETTLKQFSTVKKVFYAIEKNPLEFYDWMQVGECPKELKNCDNSNF